VPSARLETINVCGGWRRRYHFFDSDALVEQAAGKSVAAIFAEDGEADFREAESSVMQVQVHAER
jgi:shikimate kinase